MTAKPARWKVYIEYAFSPDTEEEAPIADVWSHGDKPKKHQAKSGFVYVYDVEADGRTLINERIWDGDE